MRIRTCINHCENLHSFFLCVIHSHLYVQAAKSDFGDHPHPFLPPSGHHSVLQTLFHTLNMYWYAGISFTHDDLPLVVIFSILQHRFSPKISNSPWNSLSSSLKHLSKIISSPAWPSQFLRTLFPHSQHVFNCGNLFHPRWSALGGNLLHSLTSFFSNDLQLPMKLIKIGFSSDTFSPLPTCIQWPEFFTPHDALALPILLRPHHVLDGW